MKATLGSVAGLVVHEEGVLADVGHSTMRAPSWASSTTPLLAVGAEADRLAVARAG